jgi:hypothetical protein
MYTSKGGTLSANCPLAQHLQRLHEAHRLLSRSLNKPSSFGIEVLQDPDLQSYACLAAHTLMEEVRRIQRLASDNGYENGPGTCEESLFDLKHFHLNFSKLYYRFEHFQTFCISMELVNNGWQTLRAQPFTHLT